MHPVPTAVDALVSLLRTAALDAGPLAGVRIDDGPVDGFDEPDAIGIGVLVDEVDAVTSAPEYDLHSEREPVDVQCVAQSWSGDAGTDRWARLRTRVFELLEGVRAQLVAQPGLGTAVVTSAEVTRYSLRYLDTDPGAAAVLTFTVRVNAYRRS